jgi:hypothetical protein
MNSGEENWFYKSAAALLLLTALAKLYSSGGGARVLQVQDQLLHLGYRPVMILVALVEIAVALFLLKSRGDLTRSLVLLWLSSNFIAYRLGSYLLGVHTCPCLGQLADRLPLPRGFADILLQLLVLYWFVGSLSTFWRLWGSEQWRRLALSIRGRLQKSTAAAH